ncbi:MAG: SMC-Scp complex subunit ScpB [Acetobacteraceae bacterium]|nr:SMC-Scp complex subunit ScpB [Acetobacteraceae bacterium]
MRREWLRIAEALLFASAEPVSEKALADLLPEGADAAAVLAALQEAFAGRGVELVRAAGGWMLRTAEDLAPLLRRRFEVPRRLSRAAVETLAVIAYHQPITRAEIEDLRGVALSQGTLETLVEAGFVEPKGRREIPGRPTTWGTTKAFLVHFGLTSLKDLPRLEELRAAGLLTPTPLLPISATASQDHRREPGEEERLPPLEPEPEGRETR